MAEHGGVDVSIAPNSSVTLEPADSLAFRLQAQAAPQAVLTIRNVSDERKIAFKVKTTRPLRYLVRPNQGLLAPNGSASVMVILQQKDCDELLRLDPSERQLSNDKFLVQSLFVDDGFFELVKTKSAKEMADELTNMWAHTDKKALSNKKLRCRFLQDDADLPVAAAAAPAPTPAPASPAAPEPSPVMLRYQNKQASQFSSASDLGVHASEASAESASTPVATAAQLSSALLQENSPSEKQTANHKGSDAKDPIVEVASLRKKYDELVAFTVQLTAQRDVLMSDLDKTRQLLQKATTDAQRAKKLADELSATTGLRQRKAGGASSSDDSPSSPHATAVTKSSKDQGSFGLLHLVVCAIIFFVVGRYY